MTPFSKFLFAFTFSLKSFQICLDEVSLSLRIFLTDKLLSLSHFFQIVTKAENAEF